MVAEVKKNYSEKILRQSIFLPWQVKPRMNKLIYATIPNTPFLFHSYEILFPQL